MSWYVEEAALSPGQLEIIDEIVNGKNNMFYVRGLTGTGKSILLLHVLKKLFLKNNDINICYISFSTILSDIAKTASLYGDIKDRVQFFTTKYFINKIDQSFEYILIDDIQELTLDELNKIKAQGARIVCAGDYGLQLSEERATEAEMRQTLNPRFMELTDCYRLTKRQCKLAFSLTPELRLAKGLRTRYDPEAGVELWLADSGEDEVGWVWGEALARARPGQPSAVLFPTYATLDDFAAQAARINGLGAPPAPKKFFARRDYSKFNSFFRDHNLNVRNVDQLCCSIREGLGEPRVFLMNYQSARGLSFKNVFVPFLAKETVIANHDLGLEAKLLFLACTRAGGRLRLSRAGHEPHYLTEIMPADCYVERRIPAPR